MKVAGLLARRPLEKRRGRALVVALLVVHAALLAWGAWRHSPTWDEVGFLPAGISHWEFGRFDLYRVNSPLVRMVASVPVLCAGARSDWHRYPNPIKGRPSHGIGADFIKANGPDSFWMFTLARWACIPFSLLGASICFRWAGELYGRLAGMVAIVLWCFSPNILGHGQLMTPDVGATAFGVAGCYLFWRWLKQPTWPRALAVGMMLGLAELTKMIWVVLFGLWPLVWLAWLGSHRAGRSRRDVFAQGAQLGIILLLGLYVLNLGYGFKGSFRRLGDFEFGSEALGGPRDSPTRTERGKGNRFADTWLGMVPAPLPADYLLGIDKQKQDFERKMASYLRGEWRKGGWWYYYLYGLAVKVPLGTWVLMALAVLAGPRRGGYSARWQDELVLLAPVVVVLAFVSSQTGFNHHLRYVLAIFPFAFIWAGRTARVVDLKKWWITSAAVCALVWSVTSSLWSYPHGLSYFNESVGGPAGGHAHLLDSNIDWGQDLLYLKRWLDRHPEANPLGVAYFLRHVDPRIVGIKYRLPPAGPDHGADGRPEARQNPDDRGPQPGWYALSVNKMHARDKRYAYFLRFRPVAMAGYSMYIYHITLNEANRVRRELGLPGLPETQRAPERIDNEALR